MKITFTNMVGNQEHKPMPSSSCIPDWYKKTESYIGNKKYPFVDNGTPATIKKCIPVFDSITSGYILFSPVDLFVRQVEEDGKMVPFYQWPSQDLIQFHPISQAEMHPAQNERPYPKWINHWSIKTPKGYSCLFIQPTHRELPFTILTGIVDTDKYSSPVNFPFVLNDTSFEGLIPAGTPIAQVIPFKRDTWRMEVGKEKEIKESNSTYSMLKTKFFDGYKSLFWSKKDFK